MVEVIKIGNKWVIKKDTETIEEFELDMYMKWEDKLKIIEEKIDKYNK